MAKHRVTLLALAAPFVCVDIETDEATIDPVDVIRGVVDIEELVDEAMDQLCSELTDEAVLARFIRKEGWRIDGIEVTH